MWLKYGVCFFAVSICLLIDKAHPKDKIFSIFVILKKDFQVKAFFVSNQVTHYFSYYVFVLSLIFFYGLHVEKCCLIHLNIDYLSITKIKNVLSLIILKIQHI